MAQVPFLELVGDDVNANVPNDSAVIETSNTHDNIEEPWCKPSPHIVDFFPSLKLLSAISRTIYPCPKPSSV